MAMQAKTTRQPRLPGESQKVLQSLLQELRGDIAVIPQSAVELVAALLAAQVAVPQGLSDWICGELGKRKDLSIVSPAAEAMMWIAKASFLNHEPETQSEVQSGIALLKALHMEESVYAAAAFMTTLATRLEDILGKGNLQTRASTG